MLGAVRKDGLHGQSGHIWCGVGFLLLVTCPSAFGRLSVFCGPLCEDLAHAGSRRPVVQNIVTPWSFFFIICASVEFRSLGTKQLLVIWSLGLASSYHAGHSSWDPSTRRAEWFVRWTQEVAEQHTVNTTTYEEGTGSIMYVAGAFEHERLFLAPLCKFMSMHPWSSTRTVPSYVSFFLLSLSQQVQKCRHISRAEELRTLRLAHRVDAQASAECTGI